jgi:benzoyl-CoA reductase subunit D
MKAARMSGHVLVTGGLAGDAGLVAALAEELGNQGIDMQLAVHPDSIHAGALGAALWGAFRKERLAASPFAAAAGAA